VFVRTVQQSLCPGYVTLSQQLPMCVAVPGGGGATSWLEERGIFCERYVVKLK